MVKGAAGGGHGVRRSSFKRARRARFRVRGDDQIRQDLELRALEEGSGKDNNNNNTSSNTVTVTVGGRERQRHVGPVGTINKVVLDDDIPGAGRWYCAVCSRYFANEHSLQTHLKTKKHKRRYKLFYDKKTGQLKKEEDIFHSQKIADAAKGRGFTDNGVRTTNTNTVAMHETEEEPVDFGEL